MKYIYTRTLYAIFIILAELASHSDVLFDPSKMIYYIILPKEDDNGF